MIRAMSLRGMLLSKSDPAWLEPMLTKNPGYKEVLCELLSSAAWRRDIMENHNAVSAIIASDAALSSAVTVSDFMTEAVRKERFMEAIKNSASAREAVWGSASALKAIQEGMPLDLIMSSSAFSKLIVGSNSNTYIWGVSPTKRVIIVGFSCYNQNNIDFGQSSTKGSENRVATYKNSVRGGSVCVSGGAWNYSDTPDPEFDIHTSKASGWGLYYQYISAQYFIYYLPVD